MLQGIIVKKVLDLVMKQILKQFKLDKIQKYVEEPNELDRQVKSLQKNINKYGKYIEEVEKDIAILKDVMSGNKAMKKKLDKFKKPRF
jgi:prefoldin subunit 5